MSVLGKILIRFHMTFGDITLIHFIYNDSLLNSMHLIPSNTTPVIIINYDDFSQKRRKKFVKTLSNNFICT